jgi:hypothetical protein
LGIVQGVGAKLTKVRCAGKEARGSGVGGLAQAERTKKTAMAAKLNIAARSRSGAAGRGPIHWVLRASPPTTIKAIQVVNALLTEGTMLHLPFPD